MIFFAFDCLINGFIPFFFGVLVLSSVKSFCSAAHSHAKRTKEVPDKPHDSKTGSFVDGLDGEVCDMIQFGGQFE